MWGSTQQPSQMATALGALKLSFGFDVWVGVPPTESLCSEHPWHSMDAGTQVLDPSWLELKRFLGNKFPVSQSVSKWQATEGLIQLYIALSDLVFQFVYRQSVMPATPNEFYSALKRLLKATWLSNARKEKPLTCKPWQVECVKARNSFVKKSPCPIPPMTTNSEIWLAGKHVSSWN